MVNRITNTKKEVVFVKNLCVGKTIVNAIDKENYVQQDVTV